MPAQTSDVDSAIRVSVTPAQSAFYAGETFSVTVTFTNTRSPNAPAAKRAPSHSHKRAAHSISSAPLARPPTSPITPRTALPLQSSRSTGKEKNKSERKGLIGVGVGSSLGFEHGRRKAGGKSMSVVISPEILEDVLPSTATISPLRDSSVPAHHPHARKQSVLDGQAQVQLQLKEMSMSPVPQSAAASSSAFSLSLDTISENTPSAFPPTPNFPIHAYPPIANTDAHAYPPRPGAKRPAPSGLGLGPPPAIPDQPPRTAFSSTFAQPGTELVLYSYAQLVGSVTLGEPGGLAEGRALNGVRATLLRKQAIGGGRMDISASLDPTSASAAAARSRAPMRRTHSRAASLSSSIMSLLSAPSAAQPPQPQPWSPGHKGRTPSLISSILSPSVSSPAAIGSTGSGLGLGLHTEVVEEVDPETPLPTFDVQPAMLAVDLVLGPGESRSYTYTLPLPSNLPPTYRGRVMKFAYHLVVGVCRAASSPASTPQGTSGGSTSQVMRVPVRLYNNVAATGMQRPYDLLWPVLNPQAKEQTAKVTEAIVQTGTGKKISLTRRISASPQIHAPEPTRDPAASLTDYALRLLASLPDPSGNSAKIVMSMEAMSPTAERERELLGSGELSGCREAVEILTRNMRKVSYDVNKDGVKVAVLTFTKSAYRLGETVTGIVELNERSSRARVLKLSAMLEAHETLPSSLTPFPSSQSKKLRKQHAEFHTALTPSILRTSFALDIPSDAAPAFQCHCASQSPGPGSSAATQAGSPGGLAWKVRLCLLVSVASEHTRAGFEGLRMKHLVREGPPGEWGSAWRPTRGIAPLQNIDTRKQQAHEKALRAAAGQGVQGDRAGPGAAPQRGWAAYFLSGLLTPGEREYHDGDEEDEDEDEPYGGRGPSATGEFDETQTIYPGYADGLVVDEATGEIDPGGGDAGWSELRVETVECEVPIAVWPGNTAFRPLDVVFDV